MAAEHHDGTNPERGELVREFGLRQIGREGCARGGRDGAEHGGGRFRSVRKGNRDPIGRRDPAGAQVAHDRFELVDQGVVRRRLPPRRQQRDRGRRAACGRSECLQDGGMVWGTKHPARVRSKRGDAVGIRF